MAQFDIDDFLCIETNIEIYDSIKKLAVLSSEGKVEWYLSLLSDNIDYLKENRNKPYKAINKVKEVIKSLPDQLKPFFYENLIYSLCVNFDPSLNRTIQVLDLEYKSCEEEFRASNSSFSPDSTAKLYFDDYNSYLSGQEAFYKIPGDEGWTHVNYWSWHKDNIEQDDVCETLPHEAEPLDAEMVDGAEQNILSKNVITEKQQAMVFYYLRQVHKIGYGIDLVDYSRFIEIVLNKKSSRIKNSNIYKYIKNPIYHNGEASSIKKIIKNLYFVRSLFFEITQFKVVDAIDIDISTLENDLNSL